MNFTPKSMPEITVKYSIIEGQYGNFNQPATPPEVCIADILIHGKEISYPLYSALLARFQDDWDVGILYESREKSKEEE